MRKWIRIGFPIVCIIVVGGTLVVIRNLKKEADKISKQNKVGNFVVSSNESNVSNETNEIYEKQTGGFFMGNAVVIDTNTIKENNANINLNSNTNTNITTNTSSNWSANTNQNTSNTTNTSSSKSEETKDDLANIDDKEKAIKMVAKEWGEDSSVYYTNEGMSSGYYIVAVRDKSNTSVKMFYKVDLKNNTVEIDW